MTPDIDKVTAIIREAAAVEVLPRFRRLAEGDISEKRPGEVVTVADVAAEVHLARALTGLLPGSAIVGEEMSEAEADVLGNLRAEPLAWIIDPVDGTQNFADGNACFAMIVALWRKGETVAGWLHDPIGNATVTAEIGSGAMEGDRRLRLVGGRSPGDLSGTIGKRLRGVLETKRKMGEPGVPKPLDRYGSIGREYMDIARGRIDFMRCAGKLKPWDHAAGVLIHAEAGGYSARSTDRGRYWAAAPVQDSPILMTPDRAAWAALHALFGPK